MAPQDRNLKWRLELEDAFSRQGARIQQIAAQMTKQMQEATRAVANLRGQLRALRPGGAEGQAVRAQQQALRLQQQAGNLQVQALRMRSLDLRVQQQALNLEKSRLSVLKQQQATQNQIVAASVRNRQVLGLTGSGAAGGGAGGGGRGRTTRTPPPPRNPSPSSSRNPPQDGNDVGGIGFSVRRLLGVLAVFTLFRNAVGGVKALITEGVRFNQVIERSRIGIAGIITSLATVNDEQGRATTGAEKFELAMTAAREVQKGLLLDAVRTTATFEELSQTFQVALGPGLAAGLNLDQVRQFTTAISQAATALDIPQFQLSEEVRSLLSGQIRQGQSRIASVLGLTNNDIRQFKQQGTLFEQLQSRLQGFGVAAEKASKTAGGAFLRLKDALGLVLGQAAQPLTDKLTKVLDDLLGKFAEINDTEVKLRPEAIQALQPIFQTLTDIVGDLSARLAAVDFRTLGQSIQKAINPVRQLVSSAIEIGVAFARSLPPILEMVGAVSKLLAPIVSLLAPLLQVVAAFGTFRVLGRLVTQFGALLLGPVRAFATLTGAVNQTGAAVRTLGSTFSLVFGAAGAVAIALQFTLEKITGIKASLLETIELLGGGLVRGILAAGAAIGVVSKAQLDAFDKALAQRANVIAGEQGGVGPDLGPGFGNRIEAAKVVTPEVLAQEKQDKEAQRKARSKQLEAQIDAEQLRIKREQFNVERELSILRSRGASDEDLRQSELRRERESLTAILAAEQSITDLKIQQKELDLEEAATDEDKVAIQAEIANLQAEQALKAEETKVKQRDLLAALEQERKTRRDNLAAQQDQARITGEQSIAQVIELDRTGSSAERQATIDVLANLQEQKIAQAEIAAIQNERLRQAADFERRIAAARAAGSPQLVQQLEKERTLEYEKQNQQLLIQQARIEALKREAAKLKARAEENTAAGLQFGVQEFVDQFSNAFDAALQIASQSLQAFSAFLTNTIVEGFVRAGQEGSFEGFLDVAKEQLANFLQQVAQIIIQQLIQLAVAKAVAGFGTAASGGQVQAPPVHSGGITLAEGGPVPGSAAGPAVRGAPAGDRVRALLSPREFVQPVASVNAYGADFMEAIRQRAIRPAEARALLGGRAFSPRRVSPNLRVPTFAGGGSLSGASVPRSAGGSRQAVGVLPVRAHELDRFVNNGSFDRVMLDWERRNKR